MGISLQKYFEARKQFEDKRKNISFCKILIPEINKSHIYHFNFLRFFTEYLISQWQLIFNFTINK